jgi:hypothetical protein
MKKWLHTIEIVVDKSIPFLLLVLLGIIIAEFGFHQFIEQYQKIVDGIDLFVVFIFVLDLIFKYIYCNINSSISQSLSGYICTFFEERSSLKWIY